MALNITWHKTKMACCGNCFCCQCCCREGETRTPEELVGTESAWHGSRAVICVCFFRCGLFFAVEPREPGCLLHPAERPPASTAGAKRAREPLNPPARWSNGLVWLPFILVTLCHEMPACSDAGYSLSPRFIQDLNTTVSSSDHPRRDSRGRGWDSPQERLWGEEHLKWRLQRVLPVSLPRALDSAAAAACDQELLTLCRVWTMIDASMNPMWRSSRRWKTR